jgi:hypothetical protein
MKYAIFWDVMQRGSCKNRRFGGRRFFQEPCGVILQKMTLFNSREDPKMFTMTSASIQLTSDEMLGGAMMCISIQSNSGMI